MDEEKFVMKCRMCGTTDPPNGFYPLPDGFYPMVIDKDLNEFRDCWSVCNDCHNSTDQNTPGDSIGGLDE